MGDGLAHRLGPADLRKLGRAAVDVWRRLLEVRGHSARQFRLCPAIDRLTVAQPRRTFERALARLEAAGLLARQRRRQRVDGKWSSTLHVAPLGEAETSRGVEAFWAPAATLAWCDQHRSKGRPRKLAALENVAVQSPTQRPANAGLGRKCGGSLTTYDLSSLVTNVTKRGAGQPARRPLNFLDREGRSIVTATLPPMDKPEVEKLLPLLVKSDDVSTPGKTASAVRLMARCYAAAAALVFERPVRPPSWPRAKPLPSAAAPRQYTGVGGVTVLGVVGMVDDGGPDPVLSKDWDKWLRPAAEALAEHGIPPAAWAVWVLRHAKAEQDRRGAKTWVPGMQAVFNPERIRKQRGFFRSTSEHTYGNRLKIERVHLEQMFRRREASAIARGAKPDGAYMFLASWYAEIRRAEIAEGVLDPIERFPRAAAPRKVG